MRVERTGEFMLVVACGPGWLDVIRCTPAPEPEADIPLYVWLLTAAAAWGGMQFTDALVPTLALFAIQVLCMGLVIRSIHRWLQERADWYGDA